MTGGRGPDRVVVLAGGGGTRLWPWTAPHRPKPLLPLGGGGRTLIAATLDRLDGLVPRERVRVQATRALRDVLVAGEPRLAGVSFLEEPTARDTGPAVALAMASVAAEDPAAVVAILPADHRIADEPAFRAALAAAAESAREGLPTVLGVTPRDPATRFGYVEPEPAGARGPGGALRVARFVEKPDAARAAALVARGALWNAGLFVWRADVFRTLCERHAPGLAGAVARGDWEGAPRISIDRALMEKLPEVAAVPLEAGWDDVGGWETVAALAARGDAGPAAIVTPEGDTSGSLVLRVGDAPPRAIVLGGEPLLVVMGPEGVLVTPRADAERVKTYV